MTSSVGFRNVSVSVPWTRTPVTSSFTCRSRIGSGTRPPGVLRSSSPAPAASSVTAPLSTCAGASCASTGTITFQIRESTMISLPRVCCGPSPGFLFGAMSLLQGFAFARRTKSKDGASVVDAGSGDPGGVWRVPAGTGRVRGATECGGDVRGRWGRPASRAPPGSGAADRRRPTAAGSSRRGGCGASTPRRRCRGARTRSGSSGRG